MSGCLQTLLEHGVLSTIKYHRARRHRDFGLAKQGPEQLESAHSSRLCRSEPRICIPRTASSSRSTHGPALVSAARHPTRQEPRQEEACINPWLACKRRRNGVKAPPSRHISRQQPYPPTNSQPFPCATRAPPNVRRTARFSERHANGVQSISTIGVVHGRDILHGEKLVGGSADDVFACILILFPEREGGTCI
jgi:hypothetical protein